MDKRLRPSSLSPVPKVNPCCLPKGSLQLFIAVFLDDAVSTAQRIALDAGGPTGQDACTNAKAQRWWGRERALTAAQIMSGDISELRPWTFIACVTYPWIETKSLWEIFHSTVTDKWDNLAFGSPIPYIISTHRYPLSTRLRDSLYAENST